MSSTSREKFLNVYSENFARQAPDYDSEWDDAAWWGWQARDAEVSAQSALIRELAGELREARRELNSKLISARVRGHMGEANRIVAQFARIDALLARAEEQSNGR